MKQFVLWNIVLTIVVGFLGPWSSPGTAVQEPPVEVGTTERPDNTDEQLRVFVQTYVEVRKVIAQYRLPLREVHDAETAQKLQQEAVSRVEQTLARHGFTSESFQRTFALVSADDELRGRVIKLMDSEREKLPS
ncbi:MAG TPA: DUF4168 domain-containing protein [Candidatus Binatia bacterium]|jgi:hypothetical protein